MLTQDQRNHLHTLISILLTEAVYRIKRVEGKRISVIHDELGYALGKAGGSMVEHWRKRHVPVRLSDVETLAQALVARRGMDGAWLAASRAAAGGGA